MTGTGLAKLLTSSPEWRRIPVFLMSSVVTEAMRQEALHTGIVKVFTKPITSDTLQGVWKNVQRRRHFRHQKLSNTGENDLKLEKLKSPSMKRDQNAEQILPSAKRPRTIALSSPCSEQVDASETDVSLFTKVLVYLWTISHLLLDSLTTVSCSQHSMKVMLKEVIWLDYEVTARRVEHKDFHIREKLDHSASAKLSQELDFWSSELYWWDWCSGCYKNGLRCLTV